MTLFSFDKTDARAYGLHEAIVLHYLKTGEAKSREEIDGLLHVEFDLSQVLFILGIFDEVEEIKDVLKSLEVQNAILDITEYDINDHADRCIFCIYD